MNRVGTADWLVLLGVLLIGRGAVAAAGLAKRVGLVRLAAAHSRRGLGEEASNCLRIETI